MESAFNFVTHAKEEFEKGGLEKRRRIFLALGSNLTLKGKEVGIDLEKTLLPMRRIADAGRDIHAALEPVKEGVNPPDYEKIYSENSIVSDLLYDARTIFIEAAGEPRPAYCTAFDSV